MAGDINPFQPPSSTDDHQFSLKKTSVLIVILLNIISLGLYVPIWFLSRRKALAKLREGGLSDWLAIVAFMLFALDALPIYTAIITGDTTDQSGTGFRLWQYAGLIPITILAFQVKGILQANYPDSFSGVMTFFFNIYYLQYKINRLGVMLPTSAAALKVKALIQSGASKSGGTVKFKCPACEKEGHPNNNNAVFFLYTKSWLCERVRGTDAAREHWTAIVQQLRLPPA